MHLEHGACLKQKYTHGPSVVKGDRPSSSPLLAFLRVEGQRMSLCLPGNDAKLKWASYSETSLPSEISFSQRLVHPCREKTGAHKGKILGDSDSTLIDTYTKAHFFYRLIQSLESINFLNCGPRPQVVPC